MGRHKTGESERDILRRLAEERRRTRPAELAERDRKIQKMILYGSSYEDIGKRYGLSPKTIATMIKRGKIEKGVEDCFGSSNNLGRGCYLDGLY